MMACGSSEVDTLTPDFDGTGVDVADAGSTVTIEDVSFQMMPGGERMITGRFVNNSAKNIGRAQLQVALYDEHNRSIGMMLVVVDDVGARSEKTFRHHVDSDAEGARVRSIMMQ